ncbi:uncharacterized protein N7483_005477 [Penicillium malachiteum]|uniref:uncharacterized protein n=1 Tax=Penicillium malachiteum TaxID=1324776 RepID=UPI002546AA8A|nr:uncharacterized protein N7483_005477 [Penicillium malachiteum]KAJ5730969.1 hypothetical protein N7483_005477 [Penicillium malachiteum]
MKATSYLACFLSAASTISAWELYVYSDKSCATEVSLHSGTAAKSCTAFTATIDSIQAVYDIDNFEVTVYTSDDCDTTSGYVLPPTAQCIHYGAFDNSFSSFKVTAK